MTDSKGRITEGSARELSKIVKWFRGITRGNGGKVQLPPQPYDAKPFIGITQRAIPQGTTGPVTMPNGETINVYNRFDPSMLANNNTVIYAFDGGYEMRPDNAPYTRAPNPTYPCKTTVNCLPCAQPLEVITTCSQKVKAAHSYSITGWPSDFSGMINCCNPFNQTGASFTLIYVSGCTWESTTFGCGSATTKWQLVVGDTFATLTWLIDDSHSVIYQGRTEEFSTICGGPLKLVSASTLQPCQLPCYACISAPTVLCTCAFAPSAWQVSISGLGAGSNPAWQCQQFNGTYEIPYHQKVTTDCVWSLTLPTGAQINIDMIQIGGNSNTTQQYTMFLQIYGSNLQLLYDYILRLPAEPKGTACPKSYDLPLSSSDPCGNAPPFLTITAV